MGRARQEWRRSPCCAVAPIGPPYLCWSAATQMTTLFILQGEGMDTQLGSLNVAPATVSGVHQPLLFATPSFLSGSGHGLAAFRCRGGLS